jgi:hypothetical protein
VEAEGTSPEKNARVRRMLTDAGFRRLPYPHVHRRAATGQNELYEAIRPPRGPRPLPATPAVNQTFAHLFPSNQVGSLVDALATAVEAGYRWQRGVNVGLMGDVSRR